jgi:5'-methylthioadenosine phosphorylase
VTRAPKMKKTNQSSFWIGRAITVLTANADKAKALVARLATDFPREHEPCPIGSDRALDTAIITAPEARDKKLLKKLDAVAGRVLRKR